MSRLCLRIGSTFHKFLSGCAEKCWSRAGSEEYPGEDRSSTTVRRPWSLPVQGHRASLWERSSLSMKWA